MTLVKNAEADAEAKFLQGQGMARQRQAIISGLRDSVVDFGNSVGWPPPTDPGCSLEACSLEA